MVYAPYWLPEPESRFISAIFRVCHHLVQLSNDQEASDRSRACPYLYRISHSKFVERTRVSAGQEPRSIKVLKDVEDLRHEAEVRDARWRVAAYKVIQSKSLHKRNTA